MESSVVEEQGQALTSNLADLDTERRPEEQVEDLDLSANLDGYWPSSKNVTQ